MSDRRIVLSLLASVALLCVPLAASAQTPAPAPTVPPTQAAAPATPHVPLQKTIGQAGPDIVPSLIVMNSRGATLQGGKLTLIGIAPNSIVFADRPVRAAGHALTPHLMEEWSGGQTFAADPPNATVSVFSKDGLGVRDAVVVLKTPKLEGDRLTFDVDVLEGDLTGGDGPASVFIDRFGFGGFHAGGFGGGMGGFHAGGFAGGGFRAGGFDRFGGARVNVNRTNIGVVNRGAWYRGAPVAAAAVGGAALGAAAAGAYYNNAYCGYYPYPPCY